MNKHGRKVGRKEGSRHACPCETSGLARRLLTSGLARRLLRDPFACESFLQLACRKKKVKDKRMYNNQTKGSEDEQAK